MRRFQYPVALTPETVDGFMVRFVDLPEAITSGADRRDALVQAADCLEEAIAGRITDGLEILESFSPRLNHVLLTVPAPMAAKAALYLAMRDANIKQTELAHRLDCDEKEVRRMLDPRHPTKLPRIQRAIEALGKHLIVSLEEEAA